jgi:hypothetical protein
VTAIPVYTLLAAILSVCFVITWTLSANAPFWDKVFLPGRRFWTKRTAFCASLSVAAPNVAAVFLLFSASCSLHFFIFFEVLYFFLCLALLER